MHILVWHAAFAPEHMLLWVVQLLGMSQNRERPLCEQAVALFLALMPDHAGASAGGRGVLHRHGGDGGRPGLGRVLQGVYARVRLCHWFNLLAFAAA